VLPAGIGYNFFRFWSRNNFFDYPFRVPSGSKPVPPLLLYFFGYFVPRPSNPM